MKHKFAKLINKNRVEFPSINGPTGLDINYFVDEEKLKRDGYKPFISVDRPQNGKSYNPVYTEKDNSIVQSWDEVISEIAPVYVEPSEISRRRAYEAVTDGLEAQLSYKTRKGYPIEELKALEAEIDERRAEIKKAFPDTEENSNA